MTQPNVNKAALRKVGIILTATSVVIFVVALLFFFEIAGSDLSDGIRNFIVGGLAFFSVLDGAIGWALMRLGKKA